MKKTKLILQRLKISCIKSGCALARLDYSGLTTGFQKKKKPTIPLNLFRFVDSHVISFSGDCNVETGPRRPCNVNPNFIRFFADGANNCRSARDCSRFRFWNRKGDVKENN